MAKLKFNELELSAVPVNTEIDEKKQLEDLAKKLRPLLLPQLRQSVKSLSKDVVDLNNMLISREHKFADDLKEIESKINHVNNQDLKKELENSEEFLMDRVVDCVNRVHKLEQRQQNHIIEPEVKQVIVHKNHENDIKELHEKIDRLYKAKSHKIIEIKEVESQKQKNINICLIVITTLSLLLHLI